MARSLATTCAQTFLAIAPLNLSNTGEVWITEDGRSCLKAGLKLESYVSHWLFSEIERYADKRGLSRAAVIRELLHERFDKRSESRALHDYPEVS